VLALIVASLLSLAPAGDVAPKAADLTEARRLFDEGIARYDAADYEGAIEVFTLALGEVRGQGVDDFAVRGLLLFNIGRTHMRAHEIDQDIEHLRQAQAIFERFVEEAEAHPGEVSEADVSEAQAQLEELERMLAAAAQQPVPEDRPTPEDTSDKPTADPAKLRARGIGLTAAGAALLGGGVGMLVWGTGYGPAAEAQVAELDTLGLPADSPAYADGDDFIAAERRKGAAWMAAGGVTAALGVQQLVKAKKVRERSLGASASFTRDGVWFGVSGRF
jgi:tetratricopeptide (TPR) repeat protein